MKQKNIRVWFKEPRKKAELRTMPNTLEALQGAVGGYIETYSIAMDATIVCDEEGWLKNYPPNVSMWNNVFFGNILLVGVDGEEFCDFPEQDEANMKRMFPGLFREGKQ